MADQRLLINREIRRARTTLQGEVISGLTQKLFDPNGSRSAVWVVDVRVMGQNRIAYDVIVKQAGGGGRSYAKIGLGVTLSKTLNGRWSVTGPSDRVLATGSTVELDEDTGLVVTGLPRSGFKSTKQTYDYYRGDLPGTPGSGLYGGPGYPKYLIVDGDNNPVT